MERRPGAPRARPDRRGLRHREEFEAAARRFFDRPASLLWGNETAEQAGTRFAGGVHDVLRTYREGNLTVVAHRTVNTLFLTQHEDIDAYGFWRRLGLPSFYVLSLPDFRLLDVVFDVVP